MNALTRATLVSSASRTFGMTRFSSTIKNTQTKNNSNVNESTGTKMVKDAELRLKPTDLPALKKTIAQLDEELRQKMAGLGGDGGAAGAEYEDGRPADLKRSVKNNMFRYI